MAAEFSLSKYSLNKFNSNSIGFLIILTTDDIDQEERSPFSAVTGSKTRTAIANMPADRGAYKNIDREKNRCPVIA